MRKLLFAAVAVIGLAASTTAFAQSHQGGYLGLNAGAKLTPARPAAPSLADELADPLAWCSTARDPDHCRPNAAGDHKICVADPQHYDSCRYAMSQMFHN